MGVKNTYLSIVRNDLLYLNESLKYTRQFGNSITPLCQQVCEKYLKSIVELVSDDESLLRTHSLSKIYDDLKTRGVCINADKYELSWLTNQYFDARYPGDNFVIVSSEDVDKAEDIVRRVVDSSEEWWSSYGSNIEDHESSLSALLKSASGDN